MRATHLNRTFAALLGAMLLVTPLAPLRGQEPAAAKAAASTPENGIKVLRVRSEDAEQIAALLQSFEVQVRTSRQLGLITIAGRAENVAQAEQAVHEIERLTMRTPASTAQDVELTVYFLGIMDEDFAPPPGPLRDVVAELKKAFPFQGYKLLETLVLRTRVGEDSQIEGLLPETLGEETPPKTYTFQSRVVSIEPRPNSQLVRFGSVRATIRLPIYRGPNINVTVENIEINTGLEVPDGKTVVVGKAGAVGESQGYLLVLTARVVK
jgi:hypothetical protein